MSFVPVRILQRIFPPMVTGKLTSRFLIHLFRCAEPSYKGPLSL